MAQEHMVSSISRASAALAMVVLVPNLKNKHDLKRSHNKYLFVSKLKNKYILKCFHSKDLPMGTNIIRRLNDGINKVAPRKVETFGNWRLVPATMPEHEGENQCASFAMKFVEFWDREDLSLKTVINTGRSDEMRAEMLHYLMFHPENKVDKFPDELNQFRAQ